jgi:hypothetical protein
MGDHGFEFCVVSGWREGASAYVVCEVESIVVHPDRMALKGGFSDSLAVVVEQV